MSTINTVTGSIDSSDLGMTFLHEHICSTSPGFWQAWPELFGGREPFIERASEALRELKATGGGTFVDVSTMDLGRDVRMLRDISEKSGMPIVACTGHWLDGSRSMQVRTVEEIAEFFLHEINDGLEGTGIKPGIIKVATADSAELSEFEEKILRAAARAHRESGLPITTHTGAKMEVGLRHATILEDEGVDPTRVHIGHSDDSDSFYYLTSLLDRGYWIGFDHLCWELFRKPTFVQRVATTVELINRGYAGQLTLSHDYALAISLFSTADQVEVFRPMNPDGLQFIFNRFIPALQEAGVTEETVQQIMVENPRKYFEG
jgi:phosphotriesterase-related protein